MEIVKRLFGSPRKGSTIERSNEPAEIGPDEAIADLNEMAGKTPRKRQQSLDDNETPPSKKRIVSTPSIIDSTPNSATQRTSPRLKRRDQLPASRQIRDRDDAFALPPDDMPAESQSRDLLRKPKKKVQLRATKAKQPEPSPFKTHAFGSLDPLQNAKAMLTSADSPAKRTRSKLAHVTTNPLDALQDHPIAEKPPLVTTTKPTTTESRSSSARRKPQDVESQDEHSAPENDGTSARAGEGTDKQSDAQRSTNAPAKTVKQTAQSKPSERAETSKPKSRERVSEEERQQREEEKRKKKQRDRMVELENLQELELTETEQFEEWCRTYVQGIEEAVTRMNLYDAWASMGGAHSKINENTAHISELSSVRTNAMYQQIERIVKLYAMLRREGDDVAELNKNIFKNIQVLRSRAEADFLHPADSSREVNHQTVTELFHYIIPRHVRLMKEALVARYDHGLSRGAVQELLKLARTGFNLCDIALEWRPLPRTLEVEIKKQVRIHIKPSLQQILLHFQAQHQRFAYDEWVDRKSRILSDRQIESEKLGKKRRLPTFKDRVLPPVRPLSKNVVDIDDIDLEQPQTDPSQRLERQSTEEIPAPDPSVKWSSAENVALLNGLQRYLSGDRYSHILSTYPQLSGKDLDQIVAQAQFFKRASKGRIHQLSRQGDHSLDWLETVVL